MNIHIAISIFLLRISIAWYFLYAGFSKIFDPSWSAAGYLQSATTFPEFYAWFARPENITWVNLLNEWSIALVGIALLFGVAVRLASFGGILLMILYYFPTLQFPFAGKYALVIDDHIIYAFIFLLFITAKAGMHWGVDGILKKTSIGSNKFSQLTSG